jgi:hypothetical protein
MRAVEEEERGRFWGPGQGLSGRGGAGAGAGEEGKEGGELPALLLTRCQGEWRGSWRS